MDKNMIGEDDLQEMLSLRLAQSFHKFSQGQARGKERQNKNIQSATVIGFDNSFTINGYPVLVSKDTYGNIIKSANLTTGIQMGDSVFIVKPKNSKYGITTGMPGRF